MGWTRNRLIFVAILIFGAQIAAIFGLHTREPLRARLPPLTPERLGTFTTNSVGAELEELNDPMAFAGAHERGFSASAWLRQPRMELAFSNSIPQPTFLGFERSQMEVGGANEFKGLEPELPLIRLAGKEPEQISRLRLEGAIAERGLVTKMDVPIQFGSDVISNTVVKVALRGDGFPFTARIISGSGSRGADLAALQLANEARFTPLRGDDREGKLQWGEMIFEWFTAGQPGTNVTAQAKG